jgi:hypothetical protein
MAMIEGEQRQFGACDVALSTYRVDGKNLLGVATQEPLGFPENIEAVGLTLAENELRFR